MAGIYTSKVSSLLSFSVA